MCCVWIEREIREECLKQVCQDVYNEWNLNENKSTIFFQIFYRFEYYQNTNQKVKNTENETWIKLLGVGLWSHPFLCGQLEINGTAIYTHRQVGLWASHICKVAGPQELAPQKGLPAPGVISWPLMTSAQPAPLCKLKSTSALSQPAVPGVYNSGTHFVSLQSPLHPTGLGFPIKTHWVST